MPGVIGFVENGGHSPKASNSKKNFSSLGNKLTTKKGQEKAAKMDQQFLSGALPGDKGDQRKQNALTPKSGAKAGGRGDGFTTAV